MTATAPDILTPPAPPPAPTAADVCRLFSLKPPALEMLRPGISPGQFFDELVEAGHLADARRVLAYSIAPRRAVWWAALCLHHSTAHKPLVNSSESAAYAAAVKWVIAPTEENRRAAAAAGWAAKPTSAGGQLALAAFLSGGSMSLPGLPTVEPEPYICGKLCGVVVYLASVRFDPANYKNHLREYLAIGRDLATGRLNPPAVATVETPVDVRHETAPSETWTASEGARS